MKKKVAVIGYGGQGSWHCNQILKSDVVELSGIYDVDEEKCKAADVVKFRVYKSIKELLSDKTVDIVVIATPNDVHKELAVQALLADKHVICEKPVEMTVKAVEDIIAIANKKGKLFTVHHNRRWDIDFLAMKSIVDSRNIGDLIRIESRIHGSRGIPSDWRCHKEKGGGMILDWGVHLIDQILQIITDEKIVSVYCWTTAITGTEVDDGFGLELYFESGKTAHIEVGTYNFLPMPRFYMQCEKGTARINVWNQNAHVAKLKAWNEKEVMPVLNGAGITKTMAPRDEITLYEYDVEKPISDVHNFYRNFCAAIDGKEVQKITHKQILRVIQVIETAFLSAQKGQVVNKEI